MVAMLKWVLDLGVTVLLSGLEVGALLAFVFVEGMKKWAKGGGPVPGETRRLFLVLTGGSTFSALVSWGFFLVDLPVAFGSQAVMAALLAALLVLGSGAKVASGSADIDTGAVFAGNVERRVLDGELLVASEGRLDFGGLQVRVRRRGAGARQAARTTPAYLIVFDVLDTADSPLLDEPYRVRRARLEVLFAEEVLAAPSSCARRPQTRRPSRTGSTRHGARPVSEPLSRPPARPARGPGATSTRAARPTSSPGDTPPCACPMRVHRLAVAVPRGGAWTRTGRAT
jgi:hypothetical protein